MIIVFFQNLFFPKGTQSIEVADSPANLSFWNLSGFVKKEKKRKKKGRSDKSEISRGIFHNEGRLGDKLAVEFRMERVLDNLHVHAGSQ